MGALIRHVRSAGTLAVKMFEPYTDWARGNFRPEQIATCWGGTRAARTKHASCGTGMFWSSQLVQNACSL